MAWCPKCKYEFVDGITVCPDCDCALVDKLEEEQPAESETVECSEEGLMFEEDAETHETVSRQPYVPYVNNEEKAAENRTSAYTLLSVGIVGFILMLLVLAEIIDVNLTAGSRYMICGVMGVLFLLFIIMGIVSLRNSRIFSKKATGENNLTAEIKKWALQNLSKEQINEKIAQDSLSEELLYFQRYDFVKEAITSQFVNLDEAYLDRIIEDIYSEIFDEQDTP